MTPILFLTACVNPNGMAYTKLNNPEVRLQQYKDALDWYLANTKFRILLVENSGYDFSDCYASQIADGRLEFLCFEGNDYDRSKGKGYGEACIMEYGLDHASMLNYPFSPTSEIIKVTGRLICKNINEIYLRCHSKNTVYANIGKDDWNGNICGSQVLIAPVDFWKKCFMPLKEQINDSAHRHFEHILYEAVEQWKNTGAHHREFWIPLRLEGISGTSGEAIHSTLSTSLLFQYRLMIVLHKLGYRGYLNPLYHGQQK